MVAGIVVVVTIVVVVRGIVVVVGSVVVVVGPALELEPLEIKVPTIARITTTPTAAPAINHLRFDNKPEELASPSDPDGSNGVVLGGGGGSVSPIGGDSGGTLESLGGGCSSVIRRPICWSTHCAVPLRVRSQRLIKG